MQGRFASPPVRFLVAALIVLGADAGVRADERGAPAGPPRGAAEPAPAADDCDDDDGCPAPAPAFDEKAAIHQWNRLHIGWRGWLRAARYNVWLDSVPYEGIDHRPLLGVDFYKKVGRDDLVEEFARRDKTRLNLIIAGAATFFGGILVGVSLAGAGLSGGQGGDLALTITGGIIASLGSVGGVIVFLSGAGMHADPLTLDEKHDLAERYNRKLRKVLGLPEREEPAMLRPRPPGPSLAITPLPVASGSGLALRLQF